MKLPPIKRLIPIIAPIILFALLELFFLKPHYVYLISFFLLLLVITATWKIIGRGLATSSARWLYLITPVALLLGGLLFLLFLERAWAKHLLAFALSALTGIFWENIFIYIYQHEKYQINSLENISNYLNLTSMFLFNSSLFGFFIFLNLPLWQISAVALAFTFILTFQTIWVNKIKPSSAWLPILVICLIVFEIFWAVSFLPTAFYVNGLLIATIFYLTNNLIRLHLLGTLNKKVVRRYLLLCGAVIVLVLGTAKWI
jgi:hypothetical protein